MNDPAPHILTVSPTGAATLTCPHNPPTLDMDCASMVPCGCDTDDDTACPQSPCPQSPTGHHEYGPDRDGLYRPSAMCFATVCGSDYFDDVVDTLDLDPGTYHVWPTSEDDRPGLLFNAPRPGGAP